ncbi:unnamed protein product, partial [Meganyctiphanes norvegica]
AVTAASAHPPTSTVGTFLSTTLFSTTGVLDSPVRPDNRTSSVTFAGMTSWQLYGAGGLVAALVLLVMICCCACCCRENTNKRKERGESSHELPPLNGFSAEAIPSAPGVPVQQSPTASNNSESKLYNTIEFTGQITPHSPAHNGEGSGTAKQSPVLNSVPFTENKHNSVIVH